MRNNVLTSDEFKLIYRFSIHTRKRISGISAGEQRSPIQGGGIEFADYREYQPGDDIRKVDWGVFLRLKKLLIKLCAEEKELTVMFILDTSRSMDFGSPKKLITAKKIIAVLTGIALNEGNRTYLSVINNNFNILLKTGHSQESFALVLDVLDKIKPSIDFNPLKGMKQFASQYRGKCLAVFLTDCLYPEHLDAVKIFADSKCECYLMQLLCEEELFPIQLGEAAFVDMEKNDEVNLHISREVLGRYHDEFDAFLSGISKLSNYYNINHMIIPSNTAMHQIFHSDLKSRGLVC